MIIKRGIRLAGFVIVSYFLFPAIALAHSTREDWSPHMSHMGWGWFSMAIFWGIGILLIVLLVLMIIRISSQ